jgi:hypothetical protein
MKFIVMVLAVFLAGCATKVTEMYGENGNISYRVKCINSSSCYVKAGEICGRNGFQVIHKGVDVASVASYVIIVQCH